MTRTNPRWFTVLLIAITAFSILTVSPNTSAQRKRRKVAAKKSPPNKPPSPPVTKKETGPYDIEVEVVTGRIIFTSLTTPMLKITNRDKRPIRINKIMVNDEWVITSKMRHSTNGVINLPAEMKLGDTLEMPVYPPYKKEVVFVELNTDVGVLTFKVGKQKD